MERAYKNILNERLERYGVTTLADEEALSIITGTSAAEIKKYIDTYGLRELVNFTDAMNLTKAQCKKLQLLYDMVKRILSSNFRQKPVLDSSSRAGDFMVQELQFLRNEVFKVALLNSRNQLIACETVFEGTINEAPVYPREIIRLVIGNNANAVIVAHNHPGSSLQPSQQDIEVTKRISSALQTISVKLIDHIIVAEDRYVDCQGILTPFS